MRIYQVSCDVHGFLDIQINSEKLQMATTELCLLMAMECACASRVTSPLDQNNTIQNYIIKECYVKRIGREQAFVELMWN